MTALDDLARTARECPAADLPRLPGALAEAQAVALARLTTPGAPAPVPSSGKLLTLEEVAERAGVSRRWLLSKTKGLRFRHDLSRKRVRLEEAGFLRWLQRWVDRI